MKIKILIGMLTCFLFVHCSNDSLVGEWVEPVPGMANEVQGFRLEKGGKASSINMATLQYDTWAKQGNELILAGKSIGNRQTIQFSDTMEICRITSDTLIIKRGSLNMVYTRKGTDEVVSENVQTVKGKLVIGHEVRMFVAENGIAEYWVVDKSGKLKSEYERITTGEKSYTPVYVEMKVKDLGKSDEGFAAAYAGVYEVVDIIDIHSLPIAIP